MNTFYHPNPVGQIIILDPVESHHCFHVLRLKTGDEVIVVDGKGAYYKSVIAKASHKLVELTIISTHGENHKRNYNLHIAIAPTKNMERFEWFLEKATEIGIDEITPLFCQHSNRIKMRAERLEKVLISAMKQSGRATLPTLHSPVDFGEFVTAGYDASTYIAYCSDKYRDHLLTFRHDKNKIIVLVGPEGDFSPAEIAQAMEFGFKPVSLGNSRLRTETAGIAVAQIVADRDIINELRS